MPSESSEATATLAFSNERLKIPAPEYSNIVNLSMSAGSVVLTFAYADPTELGVPDTAGTHTIHGRVIRQMAMPTDTVLALLRALVATSRSRAEQDPAWAEVARALRPAT